MVLIYKGRSSTSRNVQQHDEAFFKLGVKGGTHLPISVILGVQQSDWTSGQLLNTDSFYRPPVAFAQYIKKRKKTDSRWNLNYAQNKDSRGYSKNASCFMHLTKDDVFQPGISSKSFLDSNVNLVAPKIGDNNEAFGKKLFVSEIRLQKVFHLLDQWK